MNLVFQGIGELYEIPQGIDSTEKNPPTDMDMIDVFKQVLDQENLELAEKLFNYIGRIKSPITNEWLAEFTNGPRSGWKYMVSNVYPSVGLRDYRLSNGDNIVWVYTNDYTTDSDYRHEWGGGGTGTGGNPTRTTDVIASTGQQRLRNGHPQRNQA